MTSPTITTPVAMVIFNRPHKTAQVFEQVRRARPPVLLVVADGPRTDRPDDAGKCAEARAVIDSVDWPCEVLTNYSPVNLGCGKRVSTGLTWVFEQVEEAIVLEDDCLPHPTFFEYCQSLLEMYRDEARIMHICGNNVHRVPPPLTDSYYFSRYNYIWGWASWRRAWRNYDFEMSAWPELRSQLWLKQLFARPSDVHYWTNIFDLVSAGKLDTWDFQWTFAIWRTRGLCTVPTVNLISNIGFDAEATQTKTTDRWLANMSTGAMALPLRHPQHVARNEVLDDQIQREIFQSPGLGRRMVSRLMRLTRFIQRSSASA